MRHVRIVSFIILGLGLIISSCARKKTFYETSGLAQGTYYRVVYEDYKDRQADFDSILKQFDTTFSVYIPESMISRINNNDSTIYINNQFRYFYEKSKVIAEKTDNVFDITVAPLVNAWHFGTDTTKNHIPTKQEIDSIRQFVGMDKIYINGDKFIKKDPRVQIIGNAIAQGYSTDIIAMFLDSLGIENYLVDVGCEMRAKGHNKYGKTWTIGITRPEEGIDTLPITQSYDIAVILDNKSLATSGNYRKYYYEEGQKYSHTVNPQTGQTIPSDLLSATVIANECIEADAIATACMAMGLKQSIEFFKKYPQYEALLIYTEHDSLTLYKTDGIQIK